MSINYNYIEQKAEKILRDANLFYSPVEIETLLSEYSIHAAPIDVDDTISGLINIEGDSARIGYNKLHTETRKRFTIAHEFGHYVLHSKSDTFFVSKKTFLRNGDSSTGEIRQEREANAFAAALLMPAKLIYQKIGDGELNQRFIENLASDFGVSKQAMSIRLSTLGIIDYEWD